MAGSGGSGGRTIGKQVLGSGGRESRAGLLRHSKWRRREAAAGAAGAPRRRNGRRSQGLRGAPLTLDELRGTSMVVERASGGREGAGAGERGRL